MSETDTRMKFAAALVRLREVRKLTQEDIEERTGIPQTSISRYESGESAIPDDRRVAMLKAIGITEEEHAALGAILTGACSAQQADNAPTAKVA